MSAAGSLAALLCCAGVGVGMLSLLIPQKRTARILSFVMGLFFLVTAVKGIRSALSELDIDEEISSVAEVPTYSEQDYLNAVMQQTADTLVKVLDELLREEGIAADNIRLKLNFSQDGRIYAERIDIYISDEYRSRKDDIRSLIVGNLSKEPVIHVKGQEAE